MLSNDFSLYQLEHHLTMCRHYSKVYSTSQHDHIDQVSQGVVLSHA